MKNTMNEELLYASVDNNPYKEYLYCRGFLISDHKVVAKENWKIVQIREDLWITYDPLVEVSVINTDDQMMVLLGMVMDTEAWHMNNRKICQKLLSRRNIDLDSMYDYIDYLCGRFIILYLDEDGQPCITLDATGMRSCFYSTSAMYFASHYGLIADITKPKRSSFIHEYVEMDPQTWILPGNTTPFEEIFALTPNLEMQLTTRKTKRIFPRKPRGNYSAEYVCDFITQHISKQMETLAKNYKIMLSLTKGNDSRITMAASRKIKEQVLYFTYNIHTNSCSEDFEFGKKICAIHDLNFREVEICNDDPVVQHDIKAVYSRNHYHDFGSYIISSMKKSLPKDRIFVRSNLVEIIRQCQFYFNLRSHCASEEMVKHHYPNCENKEYVKKAYQDFWEQIHYDQIKDSNYCNSEFMFYEYRLALWLNGAVLTSDDWIADTYMLFNCRKLLELGLGMPDYYKQNNIIVYEIIKRLWPELGYYIPNTDYTLNDYRLFDTSNILELKDSTVTTGNIENSDQPEAVAMVGRYHAEIGFGTRIVHAGDYVELTLPLKVRLEGTHWIQVPVYYNLFSCDNKSIRYYVILKTSPDSEEVVSEFNPVNFSCKTNQINVITHLSANEPASLKIRLVSLKDFEAIQGSAGHILIDHITMNRQWNFQKPEQPVIMSSENMMQHLFKENKLHRK